ncbi:DUF59 domain-containing protein [Marinococcus halophilus]|uniref:DNA methyltransferase n=1 Tax=Marinococcus halophilus TaxID=1371 RepID=A0A510Y739_MARHA|nr:metal-sulfur cluster assembly factor [Marinococcus halophilus]OZT79515.1 DUF59 domain-containing protein [Marinococcus halophilus]GEK59180.1 DNA methyltransferase [Marinococcus halophilus]
MAETEEKKELEERVWAELENVIDPELGVDIVNLGLVYTVTIDDNRQANIEMTLTAMGCPLAGTIVNDINFALNDLKEYGEISEVDVDIVWNPPWSKDKMSRYAKIALGIPD